MTDFKLGSLGFSAPGEYRARMLVIAAPHKEGPAQGQMVVKQQSSFARNVVTASEDIAEGMDIVEYSEKQLAVLKQSMPNFKVLKQGTVTIDGTECFVVTAETIKVVQYFGPDDDPIINYITDAIANDDTRAATTPGYDRSVDYVTNRLRAAGYEVIAEGVETGESLAVLTGMGCDIAQGYLISRPVPS